MVYPGSFIDEVKALFPNSTQLHKALEEGSEMVGRILDDTQGLCMTPEAIIELFDSGDEDCVLQAALRARRKAALYHTWLEIYYEERGVQGIMETQTFEVKVYAAFGDIDYYLRSPFELLDVAAIANELEALGKATCGDLLDGEPYEDPEENEPIEVTITVTIAPAQTS